MGVSVSRPQRRITKAKYILTVDGGSSEFDETEEYFSLHLKNNKGETSRGGKGISKRNETGCLQFKGTRGNSGSPFDSLDTIDSRKSIPFAVLPENNTQSSTNSPNGEGGFSNVQSDDKTISVEKSSKVLFLDEVEDDLENESSARKERNVPCDQVKVNHPFQGKLRKKARASRKTRSGEETHVLDGNRGDSTRSSCCGENASDMSVTHEGLVEGRASEQEIILTDSDTDMVCLK